MAQQLNTRIVLRNDSTAKWLENQDQVLMKGEVGLEFLADGKVKMKIGDSVTAWSALPYWGGANESNVTTITLDVPADHSQVLNNLTEGAASGDFVIIKDLIGSADQPEDEKKYQYTAYHYDGTDWSAFDGNYSAENVYFTEDFTFTKAIGTVTIPSSGSKVVPAAGKNLKEFFAGVFAKEEYPSTPATSASITSSNIGAKEVGTNIEVAYAFSTEAKDYKYGPANGVTWSNYSATFNGETKTTSSGTFPSVQVTDDTSLTITGSCKNSQGAMPKTNIGNDYPSARIAEKTWSNLAKGTLTGYRAWFCGYKNGDNALTDAAAITGDQVRALGNAANGSWLSQMEVSQMKQMFFAAPAGKGYKPSIKDHSTTAPQTVQGPITVYVKGANNYATADAPDGIAYDVWYVSNADAASGSATLDIARA